MEGKELPACKADNLTANCEINDIWQPDRPPRPVVGMHNLILQKRLKAASTA
jgi:hypothetical protein